MIDVKFKNLEKSELVREAVRERMQTLIEKFPDLRRSKLQITLEMENSRLQPGPDLFKVKLHIYRGRYDGVTVQKESSNLYVAVSDMVDHMLEKLNRFGDKVRVKERKMARQISREFERLQDVSFQKIS